MFFFRQEIQVMSTSRCLQTKVNTAFKFSCSLLSVYFFYILQCSCVISTLYALVIFHTMISWYNSENWLKSMESSVDVWVQSFDQNQSVALGVAKTDTLLASDLDSPLVRDGFVLGAVLALRIVLGGQLGPLGWLVLAQVLENLFGGWLLFFVTLGAAGFQGVRQHSWNAIYVSWVMSQALITIVDCGLLSEFSVEDYSAWVRSKKTSLTVKNCFSGLWR